VPDLRYCMGYKQGMLGAAKSFTNVKTYSLAWAV
jgi:hypothetical protein